MRAFFDQQLIDNDKEFYLMPAWPRKFLATLHPNRVFAESWGYPGCRWAV